MAAARRSRLETAAATAAAAAPAASQLVAAVQRELATAASPDVADGQDAYFKGVIRHRGVKTPDVDAAVARVLRGQPQAAAAVRAAAEALLREPLQEDKLAGICLWQHHLLRGGGAAAWPRELAALRAVHEQGHVFAWSTSDWVSGRLLGPLIKQLLQRGEAGQGEACARATMAWSAAPDVWLRRASAVAFVTLARLPDSQVFPGFRAALVDTLAVTVQGQERWAQTGTGWVLRELGKADTAQLLKFVKAHLLHFSSEGLRYALERQPAAVRKSWLAQRKAAAAAASAPGKPAAPAKRRRRRG